MVDAVLISLVMNYTCHPKAWPPLGGPGLRPYCQGQILIQPDFFLEIGRRYSAHAESLIMDNSDFRYYRDYQDNPQEQNSVEWFGLCRASTRPGDAAAPVPPRFTIC